MEDMKSNDAIDSTLNVDTSANAGDIENDSLKRTMDDDESFVILYGNTCSDREEGEKLKVTVEETNGEEIGDEEIMEDDEVDDYDNYIVGDEEPEDEDPEPEDEELLEDPEEDPTYEENDYEEVMDEEINEDIMETDEQDPEEEELEEENVNKEVNEECVKHNDEIEEHVGDGEKGEMKEGIKNAEDANKAEMSAEATDGEVVKVNTNDKVSQLRKTGKLVKMKKVKLKGKSNVISCEENLDVEANNKGKMIGKVETGAQGVSEEKPHKNVGLGNKEKKNHEHEIREFQKNEKTFLKESKLHKLRNRANIEANNDEKMKGKEETGTQGAAEEKQQENAGFGNEKKENCENEIRELKKKVKTHLEEKSGKLRKIGKKGVNNNKVLNGVSKMIPKNTEDQRPANNKMAKKGKYGGMIFMCSSHTKLDCFRLKLFGLPANKRDLVLNVYEGMKLFLFDFEQKLLYGIYRAAGPGGYNIEPKAFNSGFPSQVRFNISEDCLPLPEKKFKEVIKENYFSKYRFNCRLTVEQVSNLCKLFRASSKASKFVGLNRIPKPEPRALNGERSRKRPAREERRNENRTKKQRLNGERTSKQQRGQGRVSPIRREQQRRGTKARLPPAATRALPLPPRPPPVHSHPYAYEGEHGVRLDPLDLMEIRHRERFERGRGRDPIHPNYNEYFRDSEFRHQEEILHRDPYDRYRDYPFYHHRLCDAAGPSSYHQTAGPSLYPSRGQEEYSTYNRYNSRGRRRLWY